MVDLFYMTLTTYDGETNSSCRERRVARCCDKKCLASGGWVCSPVRNVANTQKHLTVYSVYTNVYADTKTSIS